MNCAALDTEGNVWLASSNEGLICYSSGCFASPNLAAGLTDMDINAVTAAGGRYYAAVNQGLLAFDSDWHPVQNALTRALDRRSGAEPYGGQPRPPVVRHLL